MLRKQNTKCTSPPDLGIMCSGVGVREGCSSKLLVAERYPRLIGIAGRRAGIGLGMGDNRPSPR